MNVVMTGTQDQADLLARRLAGMSDATMRGTYLRFTLLEMPATQVAELMVAVHAYAEAKSPRHIALLAALSLALAHACCAALRREVAEILRTREERQLARSLSQERTAEEDAALRVPDFGLGRPVSLGERKSLARRNDREWIARVIRDPHPDVARILLLNPRVTETDIVRLCARRPVASDVLREVFLCARWIVRYPVKVALVLNPYSPLDIALQLAPLLRAQDLKRVLDATDLPPELHAACRRRTAPPDTLH
jgi:hypothetical protein